MHCYQVTRSGFYPKEVVLLHRRHQPCCSSLQISGTKKSCDVYAVYMHATMQTRGGRKKAAWEQTMAAAASLPESLQLYVLGQLLTGSPSFHAMEKLKLVCQPWHTLVTHSSLFLFQLRRQRVCALERKAYGERRALGRPGQSSPNSSRLPGSFKLPFLATSCGSIYTASAQKVPLNKTDKAKAAEGSTGLVLHTSGNSSNSGRSKEGTPFSSNSTGAAATATPACTPSTQQQIVNVPFHIVKFKPRVFAIQAKHTEVTIPQALELLQIMCDLEGSEVLMFFVLLLPAGSPGPWVQGITAGSAHIHVPCKVNWVTGDDKGVRLWPINERFKKPVVR